MFHRIICPNDQSELDFWKETDTHHVFKCPVCDYVRQGAVRHDLPERFEQLKAVNKQLSAENEELRKGQDELTNK